MISAGSAETDPRRKLLSHLNGCSGRERTRPEQRRSVAGDLHAGQAVAAIAVAPAPIAAAEVVSPARQTSPLVVTFRDTDSRASERLPTRLRASSGIAERYALNCYALHDVLWP